MALPEVKDCYNIADLEEKLGCLGYQLYYAPKLPSTMNPSRDHLREGQNLPAVFLTDHQTHGRGRIERSWFDKKGASILMTAAFQIREDTIRTFADLVALEVCMSLREVCSVDVGVKYPNDLTIGDRKLVGILTENIYKMGQKYTGASVGIGINVHYNRQELACIHTDYGATALDLYTPRPVRRQDIVVDILSRLRFLGTDCEVISTNPQARQAVDNLWGSVSTVLGQVVSIDTLGKEPFIGRVIRTQIGKGILVDDGQDGAWFDQFSTDMKVRILRDDC